MIRKIMTVLTGLTVCVSGRVATRTNPRKRKMNSSGKKPRNGTWQTVRLHAMLGALELDLKAGAA